MNTAQDTIVQLNKYPPDKYNVLVPVTSMQALSNMQRIIVNEVSLDTTVENGSGREIYYDKQTGKYAITSIGGARLAAAANISIVHTESVRTDVCEKCIEMAKATGNVQACGSCPHVYDVKMVVTVRVPEPSGGFRMISKSKEIDCSIEKASQSEKQYRKFLPHRASIAETKAFMRCIRSALGLAQGYTMQELKKPFIIAHIVPNLDAPEMRNALINNSLRDMVQSYSIRTPKGNCMKRKCLPDMIRLRITAWSLWGRSRHLKNLSGHAKWICLQTASILQTHLTADGLRTGKRMDGAIQQISPLKIWNCGSGL